MLFSEKVFYLYIEFYDFLKHTIGEMKQFDSSLLHDKLKEYFGFSSFKGNQEAVIRNVLEGKDTFVLMPTGGGKSLCYQLPAMLMDGVAIVISPLIALMKNQVDAMRTFSADSGIAHFLNSSLNKTAVAQVRADVLDGKTKLLYFAPESLTKEDNVAFLRKIKVSFYAIDEAHCISEWGHDFRPEYRRIRPIINEIGSAPLIALTATATPQGAARHPEESGHVRRLGLQMIVQPPEPLLRNRPNTTSTRHHPFHQAERGQRAASSTPEPQEGRGADRVARGQRHPALAYHAGMDVDARRQSDDFLDGARRGDRGDDRFRHGHRQTRVRYVIHYDIPQSRSKAIIGRRAVPAATAARATA